MLINFIQCQVNTRTKTLSLPRITAMYQSLTPNWLLKIWDSALIALLLRNTGQLMCSGGCRRDDCYNGFMQPLPISMVALFLATMVISCYLYIKLITSGVEPTQIGGFIVSFLPSAILTIIGWFVTKGKFIKLMFPQESNPTRNSSQVDPPTEQTPLNASINVGFMFL